MHICENSRFSYNSPMHVSLPNDFSFLSPIDFVVFFISCLYTYIQLAASEKPLIIRHTDSSTVSSSEMMFSEMSVQYNFILNDSVDYFFLKPSCDSDDLAVHIPLS